ncbi:hypothetical protein D3P07_13045 [Paenibacillus sp. 1011MAR3C5]|uniref:hypothetical protein n=1 Tax=Paenibacillus sp. 1011MAR3C5 TaxID=1675787 RepID=UPI000E6C2F39|nr:hypothetical protein [Paenibacillus sp. 1011MAR3C5]RJE88881.1 hypothetical protein D3P07_13045 [Paenibacillus sp. 1011MAR3C5]
MKTALQITGVIFILAGVIFGITQISGLKEIKEDVDYWERAAARSSDNYLIEQRYLTEKASYESKLVLTISSVVLGIITGLFFLALATIINLLQKLVNKQISTPGVHLNHTETV